MVERIVSHLPPRHMDDWLSLSLLKLIYPHAKIEYVHPQSVPEEYLKNEKVILVDAGGSYDELLNNYDHHQNKDIPCSLSLIVKHFFPEVKESLVLKAIDISDRFGFEEAVKQKLMKKDEELDRLRKIILMTEPDERTGSVVLKLLQFAPEAKLDYDGFIRMLYNSLRVQGLTEEAERKLQEQEREFMRKVQKVQVVKIEGLNVALSTESFAPYHYQFFSQSGADLLVEQNAMNKDHTSIIVNTSGENKERGTELADRIAGRYPLIFRHQSGFIRVVDCPVEEVMRGLNRFKARIRGGSP